MRKILANLGYPVPKALEVAVTRLITEKATQIFGGLRDISGKSFTIVYTQDGSGKPRRVKILSEDGRDLPEEHKLVLRKANAFIHYHFAPNQNCRPGAKWKIYASDMQELLDPYEDSYVTGHLWVERKANQADGSWDLQIKPGRIELNDDTGRKTGQLTVTSGSALVDSGDLCVSDARVEGFGDLEKPSSHHLLFQATISGKTRFQGRMVTTPLHE